MASCGTPLRLDSGIGVQCNRVTDNCECATLSSDCYAAKRTFKCSGKDGWSINHGKMIGTDHEEGTICCGYKLPEGTVCPAVPKDEQTLSYKKDFSKGFLVNEFYAWKNSELKSVNGARDSYEKSYLDVCIGSHHVRDIHGTNNVEKTEHCYRLCSDKRVNLNCKSHLREKNISICMNLCNCAFRTDQCFRN